jgi:hypothetical protein
MSTSPFSFVDYEWPVAECFELLGDEAQFFVEEGCEECLIQYIIQHRTRAIPMTYLQKYHPEIFETVENTDEEGVDFRYLEPFDLKDFDLIAQDDVLEEAFDRMPVDEYVKYAEHNHVIICSDQGQVLVEKNTLDQEDLPDIYSMELEALSLYRRQNDAWTLDEDFVWLNLEFTQEEIPELIQYMYSNHTRMISLYDLREIAPSVFESLNNSDDMDWNPNQYAENELKQLYLGLRGEIVAAAFDLIYDSRFS